MRAPVEFRFGHLPQSVNLPLIDDLERHKIGIVYKEQGAEAALALGHELVQGELKVARVEAWRDQFRKWPEAAITCFRGGQRSQISQEWLTNTGLFVPRVAGGYKAARGFLLSELGRLFEDLSFLVISGATGSGKTELLQFLKCRKSIDLEALAHHRGSAFGQLDHEQPSQATFENELAVRLIDCEEFLTAGPVLVEDEGRLIGRCLVPPRLFEIIGRAPRVHIEESFDSRVERILQSYIYETAIGRRDEESVQTGLAVFSRYQHAITAIQKRLGGTLAQSIMRDLEVARDAWREKRDFEPNRAWIASLLRHYYDPRYLQAESRSTAEITFRGNWADCAQFLAKR